MQDNLIAFSLLHFPHSSGVDLRFSWIESDFVNFCYEQEMYGIRVVT